MNSKTLIISLLLIVGYLNVSFRDKAMVAASTTINYSFNTGQYGAGTAYVGDHASNLSATLLVQEIIDTDPDLPNIPDFTRLTLTLTNSDPSMQYMCYIHNAANPSTTPNGTFYNEKPNVDFFYGEFTGNGGTKQFVFESAKTYDEVITSYAGGYFIIREGGARRLSTTDLKTYFIIGGFPVN